MAAKKTRKATSQYSPEQLRAVLDLRQGSRSRPVSGKKLSKNSGRGGRSARRASAIKEY